MPLKMYVYRVYKHFESGQRILLWAWSFSTHKEKEFISKYFTYMKKQLKLGFYQFDDCFKNSFRLQTELVKPTVPIKFPNTFDS